MIDAGRVASGNGPPNGSVKDVGVRADRADGFVLQNVTVRHAKEHDIYVLESNGYLLDHFKAYWAGEYGVLTFVEDHGLIQNCDAAGSGDSGLYPGAGAKTNAGRDVHYYRSPATARRFASATRTTTWPATRGPTARVHTSTTTTSTTTRSGSPPTCSPPPAIRGSPSRVT